MDKSAPNVIILAGPNGAGKSTMSRALFEAHLGMHYVNADTTARGLSAFRSEDMALQAGKVMLHHLHFLGDQRANFGFETTLATKSFAPWVKNLKAKGYIFHLVFLWLPSAEEAIQRVRNRVGMGGHFVPDDTVRRRHQRGLENFFNLYQPLADSWKFFHNNNPKFPLLLAEGKGIMESVFDRETWNKIKQGLNRA